MRDALSSRAALLGLAVLLLGGVGCVDEENVFEDRSAFEDPLPAAQGFVGYLQGTPGVPVCGNCHAQPDAEWGGTAHAGAWATLQGSGHAQAFCEECHTVNALGNAVTGDAGWTATGDPRYHDVQCESCHGPGEAHVAAPAASQPLASLAVGVDLTSGCGECHQGTHHPFVDEWAQSPHANVIGFAAARAECAGCHRGQGILEGWGVRARYLEKDAAEHLPIVCGVCHDPHDPTNTAQLRFPVRTTDIETHLCAQCHRRRTVPDPNSSHGLEPHAPESELLVGEAGWFPPGVEIDRGAILGTHGSEANPELCATCHVAAFEVTDQATGEFVFSATGHLFRPIPCVDESGVPTAGDCELTVEARSFGACTEAGCHSNESTALAALVAASGRIEQRAAQLLSLLEQVDPNLDGEGGEIDAVAPVFTVAEGAFFNYNLATHGGDVLPASAHNPFLTEALLLGSIQAVEEEYAVSVSTADVADRLSRIRARFSR